MPRRKRPTKPEIGNVEQQPTSSASMTPPPTMGSSSKGAENKSQISGSNKQRNKTTEKVPQGLCYLETAQGYVQHSVDLLMDQHGELFLIQKDKRKGKGKVYWSHKTNMEMYSLMVSDGVQVYVDLGEDMFPCVRTRDRELAVISHHSREDLKENLIRRLQGIYHEDEIDVTSKPIDLYLNYHTGEQVCETTPGCFKISITRYEISLSSLPGHPPRSRLLFSYVKAIIPNADASDKDKTGNDAFPCKVLCTRNLNEFSNICKDYDIESLPGGRTIDDLLWMQEYATKMILVSPEAQWKGHTTNGRYEGENALVIRIKKTGNIMNKIKKLRAYDDNDNILHFYGWQEEDDHYYLAFEMCDETLEDFLSRHNNFATTSRTESTLRLDILRGVAKGVLSLRRKGKYHGNLKPDNIFIKDKRIAKIGPCSFIYENEDDEHNSGSLNDNMQDLAKIILKCTSGGKYMVSDQKVQPDALNLCNVAEARDLIVKILDKSISSVSALLEHYFFWGPIKRLSFMCDFSEHIYNQDNSAKVVHEVTKVCRNNRVYNTLSWDKKMDETNLFFEMTQYRANKNVELYEYEEPTSLVRFIRNAFNHQGSFKDSVYNEIGYSKLDLWEYFEMTFPRLLGSLYQAGQLDHSDIPSSEIYYAYVEDETIGNADEGLPGGRSMEDICPNRTPGKTKISVDLQAKWTNNTTDGVYDGVHVCVKRIKKRSNIIDTIRRLRHDGINENVLRFYGWQEEIDSYYLAFQKCKHTLEEYVTLHNFTELSGSKPLRLDVLRGIAKGVFSLQAQNRYHGNLMPSNIFVDAYGIAKLELGRFITEEEVQEKEEEDKGGMNMQDFAKILLYCTSGGLYVVTDQKLGDDELKHCMIAEARDLIERIIENSKMTLKQVLGHHVFWGTLKRISFLGDFSNHLDRAGPNAYIARAVGKKLAEKKVFVDRWDLNYLPSALVLEMANSACKLKLPPYINTEWQSLLRIMKNVYNHYNSIPKHIRDAVGTGKGAMETHFRTTFPELVNILVNEGRPYRRSMNNFSINYSDD